MMAALGRMALVLAALLLWAWGVTHWPGGYGAGFWAWAGGLVLLSGACYRRSPRTPWGRWQVVLIVLWIVMSGLRLYRATDIPIDSGDVQTSETARPILDLEIVQGIEKGTYPNVFFTHWGLYVGWNYLAMLVIPNQIDAFRYTNAVWGALSLGAMILLAWRLGGGAVATAALVLVGLNWWHHATGRMLPILQSPCAAALTWWAFVRACDRRQPADAVLAGIIAGVSLRMYESVKAILIVIPPWWLWHAFVTPRFARRTWWVVSLTVAVSIMTLWPMFTHGGFDYFFAREHQIMFGGVEVQGSLSAAPLRHIARQVRVVTGGADLLVNDATPYPLLNPIEAGLVLLGFLYAWRHRREPHATVAAIWLAATCAAVAVSSVPDAGRRLSVALPAIGVLAGTGLMSTFNHGGLLRRAAPFWLAALLVVDVYWNATHFSHWVAAMNARCVRPH